jgi:RHS repeat-associated protein
VRLGLSFTTAGSWLLPWPIRIPEKTRSETRPKTALPLGSGLGVATHPVAQLKQEDNTVLPSLQSTHRPRSPRTHYFHTIYDANGRQVKATKSNQPDAWTVYDALGNRVATKINDIWQLMVYDAFGKLVAEYGVAAESLGGVKYIQQDWQGSVRTVSNNNGFVVARTDHQAFGEDIGIGVGLRKVEQGYSADKATKQGYGLTENDSTGLNHTWFRKLETQAGRWSSPDPYKGSMSLGDPQSFNRYSYVTNDPVNFVDPKGLFREGRWNGSWPGWFLRFFLDGLPQNPGTTRQHGEGGGGGGGNKPPPQKCDAKLTGDLELDTLTQFLFGETDKGNVSELEAIGQTFLNAHWLNSTEFGCGFLNVVKQTSRADDDRSTPFVQASNQQGISNLSTNCDGYKAAQKVAKEIIADARTTSMRMDSSPVRKKVGTEMILWFLGGATRNTPTLQYGETRFFNYFPGRREGDGTWQTAAESDSRGRNSCDKR